MLPKLRDYYTSSSNTYIITYIILLQYTCIKCFILILQVSSEKKQRTTQKKSDEKVTKNAGKKTKVARGQKRKNQSEDEGSKKKLKTVEKIMTSRGPGKRAVVSAMKSEYVY